MVPSAHMPPAAPHIPVLLEPILRILAPQPGSSVLDCTVGAGGHAAAMLERTAPDGPLIGLDADPDNLVIARERLLPFGPRVQLIHANFRHLADLHLQPVDIILADLGLSSMHVDRAERGFSFREDAPLDLRFNRTTGKTAAELLHDAREEDLIRLFGKLGELPSAPRLASVIYRAEREHAIQGTQELVRLVEQVYGYRDSRFLPQVFQALRMAVNDELGALSALLTAAEQHLRPGGRLGIITFHSLEDRMVKDAFREWTTPKRHPLTGQDAEAAPFTLLTRKPVVADVAEQVANPRSRSAKFRAVQRSERL